MGRRLIAGYLLLLALVLIALEIPLGITLASRNSQRLVADRLGDAIRFATLAEPALRTGKTDDLNFELNRYNDLYGIGAAVVDVDGRGVTAFPPDLPLSSDPVRRESRRALAGQQPTDDTTIWPWTSEPLVVAVPVGNGGEHLGAVVIVSSVDLVAGSTARTWSGLAVGGLLALVLGVFAARRFTRWTLRPVVDLDAAVNDLGAGNFAVQVPDDAGPPELRRLANAFNDMTMIVTDLLERQRSFVSHASHQLRNPLTALRLRVEDLGEDLITDEAREGHRMAIAETQRLGQVLDSLLALARVDEGRFQLERVDPEVVAESRVRAWQPVAEQRGVLLRYQRTAGGERPPAAGGEPPQVLVSAVSTALDQALDALIDNAIKFTSLDGQGGAVVVRVETSGSEAGCGVMVHVIDDGPGLSGEQRQHARERFWRAPGTQNITGSGLGLPIVSVLVEASGGRLDLLPAIPRGLDACVWLPVATSPVTGRRPDNRWRNIETTPRPGG